MKPPVSIGLALMVLAGQAFAEPVGVRASAHDGFFRLVFDWQSPVGYDARMDGQVLVVDFDRSIESDFAQVRTNLEDVVGSIDVAGDGQTVRFGLSAAHTVRHFVLDGSVVVDVAPAVAAVVPRTEDVRVRVGQHADFSRLVFDWPTSVDYEISRRGDQLHLVGPSG